MARFEALFDSCVFYPAPLRDLLIRLTRTGLFRGRWTESIHEEWIFNLLKNRPDLHREQLERTRQLMDKSVPDCLIDNYEHLIPALQLPDPNDRHVLAAAIRGKVDVIVTCNLQDFPESVLKGYEIQAEHPDEFIMHLIDLSPGSVYEIVREQRKQLKNPPKQVDDLLLSFESVGLLQTAAALRTVAEIL